MSPLQFALFFAALLTGYVLVHLRLVRFEGYLREIGGLRLLNERLQGVADSLKRAAVDRLEEKVESVHNELSDIRAVLERMERAPGARAVPETGGRVAAESEQDRVRAAVEARLLALGYSNLNIISDLSGMSLAEPAEITVECEKGKIAHKGKVLLGNGGIRDIRLQNVTQSFP